MEINNQEHLASRDIEDDKIIKIFKEKIIRYVNL